MSKESKVNLAKIVLVAAVTAAFNAPASARCIGAAGTALSGRPAPALRPRRLGLRALPGRACDAFGESGGVLPGCIPLRTGTPACACP